MNNDNVDAAGYIKRNKGDHLKFASTSRSFKVLENLGLSVLCPCGDTLVVRFDDNNTTLMIENSLDIVNYSNK